MRLKVVLIFVLSILIPTAFLAHFGLKAVRSEKSIVESNMRRVHESMADVVENEIKTALGGLSADFLNNTSLLESVLYDQASLFRGQVRIFDSAGRALGGELPKDAGVPVLIKPLKDIPYVIAVYERYPALMEGLEARARVLSLYIGIIIFSAFSILGGSFFTLHALAGEWRKARLKSEFVAAFSHDLRRPLTSIRMFSGMLKEGRAATEDKKKEYYDIIYGESEQLTGLANNILDFSRIERGRKKYLFERRNISLIVADTVESFRTNKGPSWDRIVLTMEENLPAFRLDAPAIAQALTNVLSNAVKYSPPESRIFVKVLKHQANAVIEVADKGIGISKKEHKKIFRKFYRSSRQDPNIEGTGLGLALVKYAVEAHGGRIALESAPGRGSTFSLILPIRG
ncbi:MAG: HAMP domain-containing histidine kinase [Candidatus Omnitrophica bacterium]|nr:HAMP domain-containing histidine kinase [Candidatus Omnitrophota bacterium]